MPYIDGNELLGLQREMESDITHNFLSFTLIRNESSNEAWKRILSKPNFTSLSKSVKISVAIENQPPIPTEVNNFNLIIVKKTTAITWFGILLLLGVVLVFLAMKWGMLCEPDSAALKNVKRQYSLALTQMAFWYYLVVASGIFLYIITKDLPNITPSILVLIGISSVTALTSTAMNKNKQNDVGNNLISFNAEKTVIAKRIEEIDTTLKDSPAPDKIKDLNAEKELKKIRLNELDGLIERYENSITKSTSQGFWKDLLTDPSGISLHRFQIVVWTIVFGFYFLHCVWIKLTMPDFDNTLLALMGISSGTYLGFKIPEQKI